MARPVKLRVVQGTNVKGVGMGPGGHGGGDCNARFVLRSKGAAARPVKREVMLISPPAQKEAGWWA